MFMCEGTVKGGHCGKPATWRASWSDREMFVCDTHKRQVREIYDHDHSYDQVGISWRSDTGLNSYEARKEVRG